MTKRKKAKMFIGILGGGLSGVSLQYFLHQDNEILEKEDRIGGLCRTFCKDGFYYDIGGHILFSKDKIIMDVIKRILEKNINYCRRNSQILFKGHYIKYPFENGLGGLDKEDTYDCLINYLRNKHKKPSNFLEWIYYTFGNGIAKKYLIPYNRKIWKVSLENMGIEWVERVPEPPLEDLVKSSLGIETEGYLHQLYFYYPAIGGIEGLVRALVRDNSRIITGFEVKKIRKTREGWLVSDGNNDRRYDRLVITLPVKDAVKYLEKVPARVLTAANSLRYNTVRVVLIGVDNNSLMDKTAIYLPSRDIIAHRVCQMGYFSKNNVPKGKSSLIAEITTYKGHKYYNLSDEELIETVKDELHKIGLINKKDILVTDTRTYEYGYVIYGLTYQKNMRIIRDYFRDIGIELHGRFAEFEYINMDEVIRKSIRLSEKLNK